MRTIVRAVLAAALLLTFATAAQAADTLGASVQHDVYISDSRQLDVINLSSIATTFSFETSGGWRIAPISLKLAPGKPGHVTLAGKGTDGSKVTVTVTSSAKLAPGLTRTALSFTTTIHLERPFDLGRAIALPSLALVALIPLWVLLRWVRRNVRVQIGRSRTAG